MTSQFNSLIRFKEALENLKDDIYPCSTTKRLQQVSHAVITTLSKDYALPEVITKDPDYLRIYQYSYIVIKTKTILINSLLIDGSKIKGLKTFTQKKSALEENLSWFINILRFLLQSCYVQEVQ